MLQPIWRDRQRRVRFSIDARLEHALALAALLGNRVSSIDH
ncbi:hypothetical protein [Amycolatopsis plumensis]|uniref:Transposase n=1 Tax=Amycolatopsis plumensis TaxID=236508 RepID=A0ABV5U425_9PSEU